MGSSVGFLSVISRSSVGVFREGIREVKETAILRNSTFWWRKVMRLEARITRMVFGIMNKEKRTSAAWGLRLWKIIDSN